MYFSKLWLFATTLLFCAQTWSASGIRGHIDPLPSQFSNQFNIKGWACQYGHNTSIRVHLYAGGPAGSGTYVKQVQANLNSEPAVANACGSSGKQHRFQIPISYAEATKYKGKKIYVHGISPIKSGNLTIYKSGSYRFPTPPKSQIVGHLDSVSWNGSTGSVNGWACQRGCDESVNIHLYAGGPAGQGQVVKGDTANKSSEQAVADACLSQGKKHRFNLSFSTEQMLAHAGKPLYVHGISPTQTGNRVLNRSGQLYFPNTISLSRLLQHTGHGDITIPAGLNVKIDTNANLGHVRVEGKLLCPTSGRYTLTTDGILVIGQNAAFECGTQASPYQGELQLVFKNNRDLNGMGAKAFVAMSGGTLSLHGKPGKGGFQYLVTTAVAGSRSIKVENASGWQVGDTLVIASSNFNPEHAEKRIISAIASDNKTITLNQALSHQHWGSLQQYNNGKGKSWTLDERAEVVNLSRNIKLMSADDAYIRQSAPLGAHMMVMGTGSQAYIDNVEFYRMGQAAKMGRYPFHWHKMGNVDGQYIRNASIHDSFQRCVTVHQTHYARVENNTCYNHFGHGYFLEDGNEVKNRITGNIGILSKKVSRANALLQSDIISNAPSRFASPATFWIANPDNYIVNNVAAGSEGSGFWMAFVKDAFGTKPQSTNTWAFNNNIAHSSVVGITHDGAPDGDNSNNPNNPIDKKIVNAHYSPASPPIFNNLVAFKNSLAGFYYRGSRAIYKNAILADNGISGFFAYDQELIDTLMVGFSQNHSQSEIDYHWGVAPARVSQRGLFEGLRIYDGPFYLNNVHFAGFPTNPIYKNGREITPAAIKLIGGAARYVNTSGNVTFSETPYRKLHLDPIASSWADSYSAGVYDRDGSLAGKANRIIRPNHSMNQDYRCHSGNPGLGEHDTLICNYDMSYLRIYDIKTSQGNTLDFTTIRRRLSDNHTTSVSRGTDRYLNKIGMINGSLYQYEVSALNWGSNQDYYLYFSARDQSVVSPVVWFKDVPSNCAITYNNKELSKLSTLNQLKARDGAASYRTGTNLFVKFDSYNVHTKRRTDTFRATTRYRIDCP